AATPPELSTLSLHDALPISSAVEFVTMLSASGSLVASQTRHCPNGLGCDSTVFISSSFVPGSAHRFSDTGRSISRWMSRSVSNRSEEHTSELQSPYDLVCRL